MGGLAGEHDVAAHLAGGKGRAGRGGPRAGNPVRSQIALTVLRTLCSIFPQGRLIAFGRCLLRRREECIIGMVKVGNGSSAMAALPPTTRCIMPLRRTARPLPG